MNKKLFNFVMALVLAIILLGMSIPDVSAGTPDVPLATLPNPGAIVPAPSGKYARYTNGPHLSGFGMGFITNQGQVTSSIDLGYSGNVTAPISGRLSIVKECGDHQIVFIQKDRGSDGIGWAYGLTHIWVDHKLDKQVVKQGQVIGKTVLPGNDDCGNGTGMHIHLTLMRWKMGPKGPLYTEQNIVNTYLGPWIVKNTFLDGSKHDIQLGQVIK